MRVVIIEDKVFNISRDNMIWFTEAEYKKWIDPDHTDYISKVDPNFANLGIKVYKDPNHNEFSPKTALEIEGAELYDLSKLSAGQIKGLLKCEKIN